MKNKSITKKLFAMLLAITMIVSALFTAPVIASAAGDAGPAVESKCLPLWADPTNTITQADVDAFVAGDKTTMNGAVGCYYRSTRSTNYFLFLPSTADCTNLTMWFNTTSTVTVNDVEIFNGQPTDVFSEVNEGGIQKNYTVKIGTSSYSLNVFKSGKVAAMYIDTTSGSMSSVNNSEEHTYGEGGTVMVVNNQGVIQYDGLMDKIQGRGNGTWTAGGVKNPFNVKLNVSTSLLGMEKAKKWVLLANNNDETLIKNQLSYDFAEYIGVKYQPNCKPIDLYINQQYYGSYQLAEKVELKSNRVNVTDAYENLEIANGTVDEVTGLVTPADLSTSAAVTYKSNGSSGGNSYDVGVRRYTPNQGPASSSGIGGIIGGIGGSPGSGPAIINPTDITGGYLYELEISRRWINEQAGFCAYNRQGWTVKSCDAATKDMIDYSYDLLYALGSSVYNGGTVPSNATTTSCPKASILYSTVRTTKNPAPATQYQGKKWSDLIDADSIVKYYWTQEYFKNMDSSTSSTYFYKNSDSVDTKLYAGPVWDMDNSIGYNLSGSRWGYSWTSSDGWYTKNTRIYRFHESDSSTGYSSDDEAPLSFYGALATNCTDFWQMASAYWYNVIEPATKILLGNAEDPNGVLKSTEYYINTVSLSNSMDNIRYDKNNSNPYDYAGQISGINSWFTSRNTWIDTQISKVDISNTTVTFPTVYCTGLEVKPNMTVTYNGATLQEGVDYQVEYSNNVVASKSATATITGLGLYTGSVTKAFTISTGTLVGGSATIVENAYAGDTLSVDVKNSSGQEIAQFINYQWKVDGVAISGATEPTYVVDAQYKGATITVDITGDGSNISSVGLTSNECLVSNNDRPVGYTKTIASWNYDFETNSQALLTADPNGVEFYYTATSGENAELSKLTASVNAVSTNKIKWSGTADLYVNSSNSVDPNQSPVMGTSKTDGLAWGEFPYFETVTSTVGYENVTFSAKLGGTKKAPRSWKLQYSTDGVNYVDVENASHVIVNNKTMELAFDNVSLPAECNNQENLRIRMVVFEDAAINGINAIVGVTSGDASVNNIAICGASTAVITKLSAPTVSTSSIQSDGTKIFDTDNVIIADTNGGADVFYTVNDGEPVLYEGEFNPFNSATAVKGDSAVIKAWANFGDINSTVTELTVEFAGVNLNQFVFDDYSKNVSNGVVFSNGGVYGESAKMQAYTDGKSQYVPLWNASNGAFSISPDDGALWSATSGYYFEASTAGFNDVSFTCQAYTTASGPNSASLQYSLDGVAWVDVLSNVKLEATGALNQMFMTQDLPTECANKDKIYIRLVTEENLTAGNDLTPQTELHNNASKGNFYINNIVISGADNGEIKMPYTNKTTSYFGTGAITYTSPSGVAMQCLVTDANGKVMLSGAYPETGIVISALEGFKAKTAGDYTVSVWAGDDDDRSYANVRHYYYKGETVTKFNYSDTKRPLANYLDETGTIATNTSGTTAGTLSMYPNAVDAASLSYTGTYGVKVTKPVNGFFTATKNLDVPDGNGYWLITTSTVGYTDLTLNIEQLSSNKGPRDWGVAYSLDGENYKYIPLSNARAISNDASTAPVETYNNLPLPAEMNNQEQVYIKVFINGGEAVNGTELELVDVGNTGINGVELSGVAVPVEKAVTIQAVAVNDKNATVGDSVTPATITVNGEAYEATDGSVSVNMMEYESYTISASVKGTFENTITVVCGDTLDVVQIPVVDVDMNGDGVINGKDYALIRKTAPEKQSRWNNFVNVKEKDFTY